MLVIQMGKFNRGGRLAEWDDSDLKIIFRQNYSSRRDVRTRLRWHDVGRQERFRSKGHHEPGKSFATPVNKVLETSVFINENL